MVWDGLDEVWGGLEVVWGVLGWFGVFPRTLTRVRVFTGSGLITGSDRIGPKIGLFLCLTDCFFFTRIICIKDYVFSAICIHLNLLILI